MLTLKLRFKLELKLRLMLGCVRLNIENISTHTYILYPGYVRLNIEKTKSLKGFSFGEFADSIYSLDVIFKGKFFCTLLNY